MNIRSEVGLVPSGLAGLDREPERGFLLLADISGYTSYLAGAELAHAQDVLTDLLGLVVERLRQLLAIVKLEGDAVFAYVPREQIGRGEILLELLESTYLAFRDRVESIRRQTTCRCNACRSIPSLDLKFILHYGEYLLQDISGITELVGSDVNLAHRLLKNHVGGETGWTAYVLITGPALAQMGVPAEGLHEQVERYEHLGDVRTFSLDLHARYAELLAARRVFVSPDEADQVNKFTILAPPAVVWEWMNDIEKRLQWDTYDDIRPLLRPGGRTGAGASNHCVHGKGVVLETILDWRPFEYYTVEYPMATLTRVLEPLPDGTRLQMNFKFKARLPRPIARLAAALLFKMSGQEKHHDTLVRLIEEEAARDRPAG